MTRAPIVSASILGADLAELGAAAQAAERAGCDEIHFDVMDGHFVPNISMGLPIFKSVKRRTNLPLEAHMMVTDPLAFVDDFAAAGCAIYTAHYEACGADAPALAQAIKRAGMQAGLALNPETPSSVAGKFASHFDRLLVMTVNPGAAGQAFIGEMMSKVEHLSDIARHYELDLRVAVDGGVNAATARSAAQAGADLFVAATGLYAHPDGVDAAVAAIRQAVAV